MSLVHFSFVIFVFLTGRGGASIYGKQFEDELNRELKFTGEHSCKNHN